MANWDNATALPVDPEWVDFRKKITEKLLRDLHEIEAATGIRHEIEFETTPDSALVAHFIPTGRS